MTELEQLQKENKDIREKIHFWKKEVNVAHRSRSDEIDDLNARIDYYKRELADANEKLVNTSCNYVKCFKYLKGVVKVLKNVYDPMKPACLEEVEQFISVYDYFTGFLIYTVLMIIAKAVGWLYKTILNCLFD